MNAEGNPEIVLVGLNGRLYIVDERYESAQQLADDLRRFLDGKPTIARRPSLVDRIGKWARRHKRAVLAAVGTLAVAVVALVAATLLLAHQKRQTVRALAESRQSFRQYRAQLALTENNLALLRDQNGDFQGCLVDWNSGVPRIIDLMEPTVEGGSGVSSRMLSNVDMLRKVANSFHRVSLASSPRPKPVRILVFSVG